MEEFVSGFGIYKLQPGKSHTSVDGRHKFVLFSFEKLNSVNLTVIYDRFVQQYSMIFRPTHSPPKRQDLDNIETNED
jgi:hypothetical protein